MKDMKAGVRVGVNTLGDMLRQSNRVGSVLDGKHRVADGVTVSRLLGGQGDLQVQQRRSGVGNDLDSRSSCMRDRKHHTKRTGQHMETSCAQWRYKKKTCQGEGRRLEESKHKGARRGWATDRAGLLVEAEASHLHLAVHVHRQNTDRGALPLQQGHCGREVTAAILRGGPDGQLHILRDGARDARALPHTGTRTPHGAVTSTN